MKILIVSNLYPPHYIGGYELRCAQVAEALSGAGHQVKVLTSRYGCDSENVYEEEINGVRIERSLGQYVYGCQRPISRPYFIGFVKRQLRDARHLIRNLNAFKPDVVNWWSISGLTKAILSIPKMRGIPDIFCIDDIWMIEEQDRYPGGVDPWTSAWREENKPWYWRPMFVWAMAAWKRRILKEGIDLTGRPFEPVHACFVSKFLRAEYEKHGIKFPSAEVIYGGISIEKFYCRREFEGGAQRPVRLLYAGQIISQKGLDTVVKALCLLPSSLREMTVLTVVGEDHTIGSQYLEKIKNSVRDLQLEQHVQFIGPRMYDEMPAIYRNHDVFVAPTMLQEGQGRTLIEAMLAGCAIVTTGSGATLETAKLADLPLFEKGDPKALARVLEQLIADPSILRAIAERGQNVAVREFSFDRMIKQFCETLEQLRSRGHRNVGPHPPMPT